MDVGVGLWRKLSAKEFMLLNFVLQKTLERPLDYKEIQPVHSEGDQPWVSFGRNDAKAETPVLWPPHVKSWLIGKDSDAGRDWGQEGQGWDGWMASPTRWTGVWGGDGQGGLVCSDSWDRKESDTTEQLNWTELKLVLTLFKKCINLEMLVCIIKHHFL